MNLLKLKEPFSAHDVEWRLLQSGIGRDGKVWGKALAYITNRAVMQRLDDVCGPGNWQTEIKEVQGGFLCGLGILLGTEWIWKWDGAERTEGDDKGPRMEIKGGISGAMKRVAVQWGIGRYLYDLKEGWIQVVERGTTGAHYGYAKNKDGGGGQAFDWLPPDLPDWALPQVDEAIVDTARKAFEAITYREVLTKKKDEYKAFARHGEINDATLDKIAELYKARYARLKD